MSTGSSAGGILLYISNHLFFKSKNGLYIYKFTELESTFIETLNPKKANVIMRCIYRHPHMDLNEFNDYYINNLLDRLSKENKTVFLLDDFNIDLLNYDQHSHTTEFLDSLSCHMFLPHIVQPTRKGNNSKTPIGNIYSNVITLNSILDEFTVKILDHLPQFLIVPPIYKIKYFRKRLVEDFSRKFYS